MHLLEEVRHDIHLLEEVRHDIHLLEGVLRAVDPRQLCGAEALKVSRARLLEEPVGGVQI